MARYPSYSGLSPQEVLDAIEEHFATTPAEEVVRRAEELKPPPESKPNGMAPEGTKPFFGPGGELDSFESW